MTGEQTITPSADDQPSVTDLLKRLTEQGTHLAQQQVSLVQAEVRESIGDIKAAIAAYAAAAVLGIGALGVLLMGLAYLLAEETDLALWAATLIVGAVTAVIAFILYRGAASKVSAASLTPDRSIRTMARTPDAATGKL